MKSSKMLSLLAVTMMGIVINIDAISEKSSQKTEDIADLHTLLFKNIEPTVTDILEQDKNSNLPQIYGGVENTVMPKNMIRIGIFIEASPETFFAVMKRLYGEPSIQIISLDDIENEQNFNELYKELNKK